MERTSRGGGRVWTNLNESHEMRRNGEKFSWDLKVLKIPRGDFSPINANAATISKFTLFITMTGNPKWPAVQENLFEGQQSFDRPDIMNRVFNKMLQDLMADLKIGVLGPVKAWLYTI